MGGASLTVTGPGTPPAQIGTPARVPIVDYLRLTDPPHLVAHACGSCGARYFDRRNACARCSGLTFGEVEIAREGEVRAITIVALAAPGVQVPFVPAVVDCDGTSVRGNLVHVPPDPEHVRVGMRVRLVTYVVGVDEAGTQAIGFGFEPTASAA